MYAHVAVETGSTSDLDALTYEVPAHLQSSLSLGSCVLLPLGTRQAVGYIIGFVDQPDVPNVRPIISELQSPVRLTSSLLKLARWISEEYLCPLSHVVLSIVPAVMHYRVQAGVVLLRCEPTTDGLSSSERRFFTALLERAASRKSDLHGESGEPFISLDSLSGLADRSTVQRIIRQLEEKGYVRRVYRLVGFEGKPRVLRGVRVSKETLPLTSELSEKQQEALELIKSLGRDVSIVELSQRFGISRSVVDGLCRKGCLEQVEIVVRRVPSFVRMTEIPEHLTADQQKAVNIITGAIDVGQYRGFVLRGVTASGKTEVYVRCIQHALERGRSSLLLLPEIAITTQLMNIVKSRFGDEAAVLQDRKSVV